LEPAREQLWRDGYTFRQNADVAVRRVAALVEAIEAEARLGAPLDKVVRRFVDSP
jgi:hypothetical protein